MIRYQVELEIISNTGIDDGPKDKWQQLEGRIKRILSENFFFVEDVRVVGEEETIPSEIVTDEEGN